MVRIIVGAIAGYAFVVAAVVFVFGLAGFRPDRKLSTGFMVASVAIGLVVAWMGGYVTTLIAPEAGMTPATGLAVMILVPGVYSIVSPWGRQPVWFKVAGTVLAAAGALLGGRAGPS